MNDCHFTDIDALDESDDELKLLCPICLEYISDMDKEGATVPDCGHMFHPNCIIQWQKYSMGCPMYRKEPNSIDLTNNLKERKEERTKSKDNDDSKNHVQKDDHLYISPNHRQKITRRIESDMKRKRKQDDQAMKMQKRFKKGSIQVNVGKVVTLKVDIRDRNSTIPRGIVGIIAKVASTGSGNCAIYTPHGLLGSRGRYVLYSPDQYNVVKRPTLNNELKQIQNLVLDEKFDISDKIT